MIALINCTGNTPFPLDAPDTVWVVKSGTMAVFAIPTISGAPQGARRYLFDASPGDVLFGIAPVWEGQSHKLIAVAYEETQLMPVALSDWIEQALDLQLLPEWSDRLAGVLRDCKSSRCAPASSSTKPPAKGRSPTSPLFFAANKRIFPKKERRYWWRRERWGGRWVSRFTRRQNRKTSSG
ncbi:MAG: hypothetical protein MUC60_15155 [Oscillatoria sp. Prado101]|nr:hypothetical protein [Oscillatoria sp. Prado101]